MKMIFFFCIFNEFNQIEQSIRSTDERANGFRFRIIDISFYANVNYIFFNFRAVDEHIFVSVPKF